MATLNELINKKLKILDESDIDLVFEVKKTEISILRKVLSLVNKMETESGNFVGSESAFNLALSLSKEINKIIGNSAYSKKINGYLRNFDKVEDLNKKIHKSLNDITLSKVPLSSLKKRAITDITKSLSSFETIETNFTTPIRKLIVNNVITGAGVEQTKQLLRDFISGNEKRNGQLSRYVSQISRDAVTQYDGLVNDVAAKEYNLNCYRYVGSLIKDSRPQCRRWVIDKKRVLKKSELQSEINWAENNGRGHNPDTTPKTFSTYRGGFNCRHSAIPFRCEDEN